MRPCEIVKLVEYIKKQTGHTGDIFININDNAIPVEWIKDKMDELEGTGRFELSEYLDELLEDWEKENEKDI